MLGQERFGGLFFSKVVELSLAGRCCFFCVQRRAVRVLLGALCSAKASGGVSFLCLPVLSSAFGK